VLRYLLPLLNGGMKWNEKLRFLVPFHTSIQQRLLKYVGTIKPKPKMLCCPLCGQHSILGLGLITITYLLVGDRHQHGYRARLYRVGLSGKDWAVLGRGKIIRGGERGIHNSVPAFCRFQGRQFEGKGSPVGI